MKENGYFVLLTYFGRSERWGLEQKIEFVVSKFIVVFVN